MSDFNNATLEHHTPVDPKMTEQITDSDNHAAVTDAAASPSEDSGSAASNTHNAEPEPEFKKNNVKKMVDFFKKLADGENGNRTAAFGNGAHEESAALDCNEELSAEVTDEARDDKKTDCGDN